MRPVAPGAATALIFEMLAKAITAQRDGISVEVRTHLNEPAARALGLWGEGDITLRMEPAFGQRPGDLEHLRG